MLWRFKSHHWVLAGIRRFRQPYGSVRRLSQSVKDDPTNIRNLALVAHIDSGKTTLTESILSATGYLSEPGTVDTGSTTTDFLPAERERGITIQSASIPVSWKHWTFNLIDTPGHADFGMEVECASRVVDGAVVLIDAVEGIESQTQGVWNQLDRYNVRSRLLFMNKMDRPGASFRSSILTVLSHRLHPKPMVLTLPISSFDPQAYKSAEPGIEGIVDLVQWELWKWDSTGTETRLALPRTADDLQSCGYFPPSHPVLSHLISSRTSLLENLSMFSDDFMESLLSLPPESSSYLSLETDALMPTLRSATIKSEILPVVCGSAMKHIGTSLVLDYVGKLFPSPSDVAQSSADDGLVQMLAWKVAWDKRRGWMTFVRIYSGTLTRKTALFNITQNQTEKISKLMLFYASQPEEVECLTFGTVGVILGLKHTRTGDTLVSASGGGRTKPKAPVATLLRDIIPPPAVMSASIVPQSKSDLEPVQDALFALSRTDPSARVEVAEGQLLVHGLGSLHLEIIEGRLKDEWGVNFEAGRRRVSYREGFPANEIDVDTEWRTEVSGRTVVVHMHFRLRALRDDEEGDPSWDGNVVVNGKGEPIRHPNIEHDIRSPWIHVGEGLSTVFSASPLTSLPISRARVQIESFSLPEGASMSLLIGATCALFRHAMAGARMGPIMEPYIRLKVAVPEEHFGKVMKYLIEKGGEVVDGSSHASPTVGESDDTMPYTQDGIYVPPDWMSPSASSLSGNALDHGSGAKRTVYAVAPLSKMLDFSSALRALSGGHGAFEMSNAGFKAVGEERQMEILKEIGRV